MMYSLRRTILIAVVLALGVAACGNGEDSATTTEPAESTTTAAGATTTAGGDTTTTAAAAGEPIVFGMIEDTSGGASAYSLVQTIGIELAIEEINAAGGILGRPVELIRENDQNESSQTPTLTRRLIEQGAHVILMNSGSASAIAAKPVCQEGIVCLAPGNVSPGIVTPPDADFSYTIAPPSTAMGAAYAGGMPAAGVQRLALISDDSPTMEGFNEFFVPILEEAGIEIVAREIVPLNASDASAQIARIADTDPDALMVSSLGGQTEILMHNTAELQMPDVPRYTVASIGNQPESWALASPGVLEGTVFLGTIDSTNPRTQELEQKLVDRLGGDFVALTGYHAQGYTSIQLLKLAIENAGGTDDLVAINDAFEAITGFPPYFGQEQFTLSFGPDKHAGADGDCGIVLAEFGADNQPAAPWDVFQTSC